VPLTPFITIASERSTVPVTTLDPRSALVVIDLQKGVVAMPTAHAMDGVIGNSVKLVEAFRKHDLPVILVSVEGAPSGRTEQQGGGGGQRPADWAELIPELNEQASDHRIIKKSRGAFTKTGLDDLLAGLGVTQVVIVGVATGSGVESTANQAFEHGYNVTLATDAMTDMRADQHEWSLTRAFPRIGETGTTEEILGLLASTRS
jgi:nicotinamidase-related amidase